MELTFDFVRSGPSNFLVAIWAIWHSGILSLKGVGGREGGVYGLAGKD